MGGARLLTGAPGGILAGFPARDDERGILVEAAGGLTDGWAAPQLEELRGLWPEVARMREAMGPERMAKDEAHLRLERAGTLAAWTLQREWAFVQSWFSPQDPQANAFAPAPALGLAVTSLQRRVTRLDALRGAYLAHADIPDAAARAQWLTQVSAQLFRAITQARMAGAAVPVPLAEARQRVDLAYATVRDAALARRALSTADALRLFPDLSPAWRWERLVQTSTVDV